VKESSGNFSSAYITFIIQQGEEPDDECAPGAFNRWSSFDHLRVEPVNLFLFELRTRRSRGLPVEFFPPERGRILDFDFVVGPEMTQFRQGGRFDNLWSCSFRRLARQPLSAPEPDEAAAQRSRCRKEKQLHDDLFPIREVMTAGASGKMIFILGSDAVRVIPLKRPESDKPLSGAGSPW
jgi:hypothetical protein